MASLLAEQLEFDFFSAPEVPNLEKNPPELSKLNPFKEELFNDIGRAFGIETPQLTKSLEENTPSLKEDLSKHPIHQWVRENAPKAEVDPNPILKALERPGVLPRSEEKNSYLFRNPEERFRSKLRTYRNDKALDEKGEQLLENAGRLNMLSTIAEYASQAVENSELRIDEQYRNQLFELSRNADNTFFKHRDSLKHNKDGSLKLEDFGENLNNTRKGRATNRTNSSHQFLCEPISDTERRLASEPLEKVWPKSSILELYKENARAAACLWIVRSSLGERRPQKSSYKYQNYLNAASAAIALHRQVLTGELAPEAETQAFDRFYMARDNYKVLSHVNPKYWPFFNPDRIGNAQKICEWNNLKLSDGSDINSYKYQCVLPGTGNADNHPLCLMNSEGKRYGFYAVAVGNTAEEFEVNIEKQLGITFAKELQERDKSAKAEKGSASKAPELPIKFLGRGVRANSTYEVYGKQGTIELQLTERIAFENDKAFWDYIENHRTELEDKYRELRAEYSKTEKDWRSSTPIRDRIGPDYREGKDATPDMFMNTFGFRGVEFGNWVKQGKNGRERQWMLNNAYDALYDLSKILNIPPKAVALNGELGLCFGSRGFGSASAHYEPENRIINLTKTKGYSSLAHEWFHALDHHMARDMYEAKLFESKYLSDRAESVQYGLSEEYKEKLKKQIEPYSHTPDAVISRIEKTIVNHPLFHLVKNDDPVKNASEGIQPFELEIKTQHAGWKDGSSDTYELEHRITKNDIKAAPFKYEDKIRSEVFHAWGETIEAIRGSSMHRRMLKKNDYWHSKIEEAARSFEAFVEVRSKELGIRNDFLANDAYRKEPEKQQSYYPYLDGKDVENVREKFQKLFQTIKTKETEKGVALFSKTREGKSGAKISEIRAALDKKFGKTTIDALIDNGRLKIVSGINEVLPHLSPLSEELKNSKKNTKTGFIVPDELAHEGNQEGIFATLKLKENLRFPSGKVIVKEGFHIAYQHRGFGAKHLTGNLLEHPNRSLSVTQENKTEEALLSLKEVLGSASELFKVKEDQFVFYSNKYNRGVPCKLNDDGDLFAVITDRPVNIRGNRYKIWGNDSVRLSGALIFPDHTASVTAPSLVPAIEQNQNGTQPVKSHKGLYTDVDYTEELKNNLAQARSGEKRSFKKTPHFINSGEGRVQGFYEQEHKTAFLIAENLVPEAASSVLLHEVGIHMAYDSELKAKVLPIIKEAPRILEEGFRQRDPVCLAAEIRLKDSGITKDHPNYAEETAAYLVEECSKQRNALPKLQRWYKQMRSAVSVWLVGHGFKDSKTLTTDDFVTIAKANLKALAEQKELTASQTINEKIHFSLNKQHQETLELIRKELPKADPAMQNPKLLGKVLHAVEERMLDCERQEKILKINSEFFKRQTSADRTKTDQKIPEQNKTKGLER